MYFAVRALPVFDEGRFLAPFNDFFEAVLPFAGFFIALVAGLHLFCHTSVRAFLFGRGRRPDVKTAVAAGALMFCGMILASVPDLKYTTVENTDVTLILTNLIFCLMFVWIQTTTEEIIFRGFFLRPPYGNKIPALPKGLLFAFISSLLFMAAHLANPEVQSLPFGPDLILGAASYFVGAFFLYICNLLIGGMEAGVVMHFLNNFYCFFLVRAKITAVETPAIFVDNAEAATGTITFFSELLIYALPLFYLVIKYRHRRREG